MGDKLLSAFFFIASAFLLASHVDAAPRDGGVQPSMVVSSVSVSVSLPSSSNEE